MAGERAESCVHLYQRRMDIYLNEATTALSKAKLQRREVHGATYRPTYCDEDVVLFNTSNFAVCIKIQRFFDA